MALFVRAYPMKGTSKDLDAFLSWVDAHPDDVAALYRRNGISHESWHLQEAGGLSVVIGVSIIEDPEGSAKRYGATDVAFEREFQRRVQALTRADLTDTPQGPSTRQIFSFSDAAKPEHNLSAM